MTEHLIPIFQKSRSESNLAAGTNERVTPTLGDAAWIR